MRTAPYIQTLWAMGGPFEGEAGKPHTRVTVQEPWPGGTAGVGSGNEKHVIHAVSSPVGSSASRGVPVRWYQKEDNSQQEIEIPNVQSVTIDRSIETDAQTCTVTIYNQWMFTNGAASPNAIEIGQHGYFTPTRGTTMESLARWGHVTNEWEDVLVPNAILRTYQGFGGHEKSREDAVADGNIILTGVWLIDEVSITTDGMLAVKCRDMGKLLVDQQLYPPLVPSDKYPLTYRRWVYTQRRIKARAVAETTTSTVSPGIKRTRLRDSAVDRWYPQSSPGSDLDTGGFVLHGHKAADCLDSNATTFCLSVGNAQPDGAYATDWWEFDCGEVINAVFMRPWGGNYTMYISVMENGRWQGSETIPYSTAAIQDQDYWVDTGANIRYVARFSTPWETGKDYVLPRAYRAERVRVSFRNHTLSQWGPFYYRCGMREFRCKATSGAAYTTTTTNVLQPYFFAADHHPVSGYMVVSSFYQVDVFGDQRFFPQSGGEPGTVASSDAYAVALSPSANGCYIASRNGEIRTYGDAVWRGSPKSTYNYVDHPRYGIGDIAVMPTNGGYWALSHDGRLFAFGDAPHLGANAGVGDSRMTGIDVTPSGAGYWLMDGRGIVTAYGDAVHYGNFDKAILTPDTYNNGETAISFRRTSTGDGYWIMTSSGRVQAFGDAEFFGQPSLIREDPDDYSRWSVIMPSPNDRGYLMLKGDGTIVGFGDYDHYGSVIPGTSGQLRKPGNYTDYADIIKDLALWAGFMLYDPDLPGNEPVKVYGNIETTGAWAEEPLPDEIFDKKPVIDAMTEIKEVVGYLLYVDDEGGIRFECVDEATEILTKRGWLRYHEVQTGDETLSYDRERKVSTWTPIEKLNQYTVNNEKMISIESRSHSSLTTPNHRWWVEPATRERQGNARWATSDDLRYDHTIPIVAPYDDAPSVAEYSDAFVELVGWWVTEGCESSRYICQSHVVNPENCERIDAVFRAEYGSPGTGRGRVWARHSFPSRERDYVWNFGSKIFADLQAVAPGRVFDMQFLLSLTRQQLELLVETCMSGDGHEQNVREWGPYGRYTQQSLDAVRSLEIACVLAGIAPRTTYSEKRNIYRTSYLKTTRIKPVGASRQAGGSARIETVEYSGVVWCPTLQDNHVWLARRNGTVFFTGNSPNWWTAGNFDELGERVEYIPEVDERVNMSNYGLSFNDDDLRSLIIISSEDPDGEGTKTITTKLVPQTATALRGLLKPAMWVNSWFQFEAEQQIMAELISLHIWFSRRIGQVSCAANPAIQINDQIRIYERVTSEVYLHYVRGVQTVHDLDTGAYTMTLTTNWLGSGEDWAITTDQSMKDDPDHFVISQRTWDYLMNRAEGEGEHIPLGDDELINEPPPEVPTWEAPPPAEPPPPEDTGSGTTEPPPAPPPPPPPPPPETVTGDLGSGTTYYVSNSGNDGSNGTSTSTPWATIAKVNSFNFQPGDNVLFKRGGHWETQTLVIDNSGTSTNRITFADYGTGDLPTIDGGGNYANGSPLNAAPGPWPQKGNWVPMEINSNYVTVRNFRLQQSNWTGIDIRGSHVIVEGCTTRWNVTGIETDDSCQYATIRYNQIIDNAALSVNTPQSYHPDDDSGAFGILLHGDYADIHHNTISGHRAWSYDYGFDGAAIEVFRGRHNVCHHNWCENNEAFSELGHTESYGNIYHHNVIINTTPGAIGLNIQGTGTFGPVQGTKFEHNTVYMPAASCQGIIVGTNANCVAYNNIVWATMKAGSTASAIDENNNLYYGHSQQQIKSIHDPGQDGIGPQSITGQNPLFVNAGAEDFHLQSGSPAINQGVNRGYTTDYDGNPRNVGGAPDIGAFERQ